MISFMMPCPSAPIMTAVLSKKSGCDKTLCATISETSSLCQIEIGRHKKIKNLHIIAVVSVLLGTQKFFRFDISL